MKTQSRTRVRQNGYIVDKLVIGLLLFVLLPLWLLGNLFVSVFPPASSTAVASRTSASSLATDSSREPPGTGESANNPTDSGAPPAKEHYRGEAADESRPDRSTPAPVRSEPEEPSEQRPGLEVDGQNLATGLGEVHSPRQEPRGFAPPVENTVPLPSLPSDVALPPPVANVQPQVRTWTSLDGKQVEATLVQVVGETVRLQRATDGRVINNVPITAFSKIDQAYIAAFQAQQEATGR